MTNTVSKKLLIDLFGFVMEIVGSAAEKAKSNESKANKKSKEENASKARNSVPSI